jgi:chitinase
LIKRLRSHFSKDGSKDYYITGSPQCPYPDAMLAEALEDSNFDAVHVQFYNNYCSTTSAHFNFDDWDTWAKKSSHNKKVKVLVGLPGSDGAANSGYVPFQQLKPIIKKLQSSFSSFGGVMIWGKTWLFI